VEQINQTSPGTREPKAWIFVHVHQADFCNNTEFHDASTTVPLSGSELKFTGELNSATLHATVNMVDVETNIPFEVTIDLTWTVNSSQRQENFNSHYNFEGCHFVLNYITAYRFAKVSGTVMLGDENLTPEGSQLSGRIFSMEQSQAIHGCG